MAKSPLARRLIAVPWDGREVAVKPSFDFINRVESGPRAVSLYAILQSEKLSDHAHVIHCALASAGVDADYGEVGQALLDDPELYMTRSLELLGEAVNPESARETAPAGAKKSPTTPAPSAPNTSAPASKSPSAPGASPPANSGD